MHCEIKSEKLKAVLAVVECQAQAENRIRITIEQDEGAYRLSMHTAPHDERPEESTS
jgi:hypothetical protein